MDEQPTRGKGLAETAVLPAKLRELTFQRFVQLEQELLAILQRRFHVVHAVL